MTLQLRIAARTDVGQVRDHQEDDYAVASDLTIDYWGFKKSEVFKTSSLGTLLLVADGMGGANAGEVASRTAVEGVRSYFSKLSKLGQTLDQLPKKPNEILKDAILSAHQHILHKAETDPETQGMGTTIVLAWIIGNAVHVSWVGDSRCYLLNVSQGLKALSKDHSYVQQLIDKGELKEEESFLHPHRNVILQSLGGIAQLPQPSYNQLNLEAGDRILLCSDGLNTMLQDDAIHTILAEVQDIDDCVRALISAANEAGGRDNITVILADALGDKAVIHKKPATSKPQARVDSPAQPKAIPYQEPVNQNVTFDHQPIPTPPAKRRSLLLPVLIVFVVLASVIALVFWFNKKNEIAPDPKDITEINDRWKARLERDSIENARRKAHEATSSTGSAAENPNQQIPDTTKPVQPPISPDPKTQRPVNPESFKGQIILSRSFEVRNYALQEKKKLEAKFGSKYFIDFKVTNNCGSPGKIDSCFLVILGAFPNKSVADSFEKRNPTIGRYYAQGPNRYNRH